MIHLLRHDKHINRKEWVEIEFEVRVGVYSDSYFYSADVLDEVSLDGLLEVAYEAGIMITIKDGYFNFKHKAGDTFGIAFTGNLFREWFGIDSFSNVIEYTADKKGSLLLPLEEVENAIVCKPSIHFRDKEDGEISVNGITYNIKYNDLAPIWRIKIEGLNDDDMKPQLIFCESSGNDCVEIIDNDHQFNFLKSPDLRIMSDEGYVQGSFDSVKYDLSIKMSEVSYDDIKYFISEPITLLDSPLSDLNIDNYLGGGISYNSGVFYFKVIGKNKNPSIQNRYITVNEDSTTSSALYSSLTTTPFKKPKTLGDGIYFINTANSIRKILTSGSLAAGATITEGVLDYQFITKNIIVYDLGNIRRFEIMKISNNLTELGRSGQNTYRKTSGGYVSDNTAIIEHSSVNNENCFTVWSTSSNTPLYETYFSQECDSREKTLRQYMIGNGVVAFEYDRIIDIFDIKEYVTNKEAKNWLVQVEKHKLDIFVMVKDNCLLHGYFDGRSVKLTRITYKNGCKRHDLLFNTEKTAVIDIDLHYTNNCIMLVIIYGKNQINMLRFNMVEEEL